MILQNDYCWKMSWTTLLLGNSNFPSIAFVHLCISPTNFDSRSSAVVRKLETCKYVINFIISWIILTRLAFSILMKKNTSIQKWTSYLILLVTISRYVSNKSSYIDANENRTGPSYYWFERLQLNSHNLTVLKRVLVIWSCDMHPITQSCNNLLMTTIRNDDKNFSMSHETDDVPTPFSIDGSDDKSCWNNSKYIQLLFQVGHAIRTITCVPYFLLVIFWVWLSDDEDHTHKYDNSNYDYR